MADTEQPTGTHKVGEMAPDPYSHWLPLTPSTQVARRPGPCSIGALHHADRPQPSKEISVQVDGISTKMLTRRYGGLNAMDL